MRSIKPICISRCHKIRNVPLRSPRAASIMSQNVPAWATDVDVASLSQWLGFNVDSFTLESPRELEQSECCQLSVHGASAGGHKAIHLQLLLKRYHLRRLMRRIPKPEEKWRISARSFINEYEFLRAKGVLKQLHDFMHPHAGVPTVYYTRGSVSESDWFDRQYDFLFELLPSHEFSQAHQLNLQQSRAAMILLARFHTFFWKSKATTDQQPVTVQGDGPIAQWNGVFPRGGWWRKELRPSVKYERIPEALEGLNKAFPEQDLFGGDLAGKETHRAMKMLKDMVDELGHVLANAPDRTLVHGDCKTSNMFFRPSLLNTQQGPGLQAFAIDFQWTGRACSGMADVVYCLYGGVQYEVLAEHEQQLLDTYYQHLHTALRERGLDPEVEASRSWLDTHLSLETLAYWATALPQLLDGLTPETCQENMNKYGWLTHEMDARNASLLARRAVTSIGKVEAAGGLRHLIHTHP